MTKTCSKCNLEKTLEDFVKRGTKYRTWCKSCKRESNQAHYANNKAYYAEKKARNFRALMKWFWKLKTSPCMDCGNSYHPIAMEWDHRPGEEKVAAVSSLLNTSSKAKILAEIAKCDLVCAICHRMRTLDRYTNADWSNWQDDTP